MLPSIAAMLSHGYFRFVRVAEVAFRAHVSLPFGVFAAGRGSLSGGAAIGYVAALALRAVTQLAVARSLGVSLSGIDLHAFGGVARPGGIATTHDKRLLAWSGVLAHVIAAATTFAIVGAIGAPSSHLASEIVFVLGWGNAVLVLLNLLPVRGLDGEHLFARVPREDDEDEPLPPMPAEIRREIDRIVRRATRSRETAESERPPRG